MRHFKSVCHLLNHTHFALRILFWNGPLENHRHADTFSTEVQVIYMYGKASNSCTKYL